MKLKKPILVAVTVTTCMGVFVLGSSRLGLTSGKVAAKGVTVNHKVTFVKAADLAAGNACEPIELAILADIVLDVLVDIIADVAADAVADAVMDGIVDAAADAMVDVYADITEDAAVDLIEAAVEDFEMGIPNIEESIVEDLTQNEIENAMENALEDIIVDMDFIEDVGYTAIFDVPDMTDNYVDFEDYTEEMEI